MTTLQLLLHTALLGVAATLLFDVWLLALARLGQPTMNLAHVGRWVGHLARGTVCHAAIARAAPVRGEHVLGWLVHYATGVAFAVLLVGLGGESWLRQPQWAAAVMLGVGTVAVPLGIMQPAMGAGFAASRTATPWRNRSRSLANHAVFGLALYLAGAALACVMQAP